MYIPNGIKASLNEVYIKRLREFEDKARSIPFPDLEAEIKRYEQQASLPRSMVDQLLDIYLGKDPQEAHHHYINVRVYHQRKEQNR